MSWPLLAVIFSGWIYVDAAYRGPRWQRWAFKPVTMLLMLLWAWQSPELTGVSYLIPIGLLASLAADIVQAVSQERVLYAVGALIVSHLAYTLCFASSLALSFYWPPVVILLAVGLTIMALLWNRLADMRWPAAAYLAVTLLMVGITTSSYLAAPNDMAFSQLIGSVLLLMSAILWLTDKYYLPFKAASAAIAVCYFLGHFTIVRSLHI
ncbi:YhhN-like protein [Leminorella richardii]|uniref:YhhN-like protein n=1 Tax=Leminorella richardii TaxID=158841 RepID=A0A2X4UIZ4_9GAMM|nr:lysoplasmalogenase [Leminorella richardii]SQI34572.1 YhhN-like protein [Leminorella richardii]